MIAARIALTAVELRANASGVAFCRSRRASRPEIAPSLRPAPEGGSPWMKPASQAEGRDKGSPRILRGSPRAAARAPWRLTAGHAPPAGWPAD
jgi:hypothetical protein